MVRFALLGKLLGSKGHWLGLEDQLLMGGGVNLQLGALVESGRHVAGGVLRCSVELNLAGLDPMLPVGEAFNSDAVYAMATCLAERHEPLVAGRARHLDHGACLLF